MTSKEKIEPRDIIIFCAKWCAACNEFQELLNNNIDNISANIYWVDIEDPLLMPDDLDIEDLPSATVIEDLNVIFFGSIKPKIAVLQALTQLKCGHNLKQDNKYRQINNESSACISNLQYNLTILELYKNIKNISLNLAD